MRLLTLTVLLAFFLPSEHVAFAQEDRQETEQRLEQIRAMIEEDQERLSETAEAVQSSQQTLDNLNREVALRQELVGTYQHRLDELNAEETSLRRSLAELESQIEDLREGYQQRANRAYKYGRLHDLALIFSSSSINQMLVRVRYLRQFADQRQGQLESIQGTARQITRQRAELEERREETVALLREAENERTNLARAQANRESVIQELRQEETALRQEIDQRQAQARELEARLRRMVARETQRERQVQRESPARREEFIELTGSFTENQGRLPWPSNGVVKERFGTVVNPVYGTSTPNPGMMIATTSQEQVYSIFEGRVINVDAMPDIGTTVFIQHGEYTTVYGNFSMLYVGNDDYVNAGQVIGRAGTDDEPRGMGIFFAIFKDGEPIDPANWLQSR